MSFATARNRARGIRRTPVGGLSGRYHPAKRANDAGRTGKETFGMRFLMALCMALAAALVLPAAARAQDGPLRIEITEVSFLPKFTSVAISPLG